MSSYLERGRPVTVLARFRLPSKANPPQQPHQQDGDDRD
jgi:hypothetical protein